MFKINDDNSMEIIRGDTGSFDFTLTEKDEHGEETPSYSGNKLTISASSSSYGQFYSGERYYLTYVY